MISHFSGEAGPAKSQLLIGTPTSLLCSALSLSTTGTLASLVLSHEGQARPGQARQMVLWWLLSQGLLELKQACPASDDLPDHEAG